MTAKLSAVEVATGQTMVKTGQFRGKQRRGAHAVRPIPYVNPTFPSLGIEVFTLSEVRRRDRTGYLKDLQRPAFHALIYVTAGRGTHQVDFERYVCAPGTLLLVQPGQVQRFSDDVDLDADIVIFTPEFLPFDSKRGGKPGFSVNPLDPTWTIVAPALKDDEQNRIRDNLLAIKREYQATDGGALSASILQHLLHAALLQIARGCSRVSHDPLKLDSLKIYRRFILELEKCFAQTQRVEDYAKKLACSPKTLGRACIAASGASTKALIERRVLLEAKRLLAHTDLSVTVIAEEVGYADATSFVKFFRKRENVTPSDFRG